MLLRIASALVLIPLTLLLVLFARPLYFLLGLALVGTLSLREYLTLTAKMGMRPQPGFGYAGFLLLLAALYYRPLPPLLALAMLVAAAFLAAWGVGRRCATA